jgi:DNA-binding winged helix-turn-helix (wHTH) protein
MVNAGPGRVKALGAKEKALLILRQGDEVREWRIAERVTLGRDEDCEVHLPDRTVSRRHATVTMGEDGYVLVDHASKNGTFVNGIPVAAAVVLRDGDEVSVAARYKLVFVDAEATAPLVFESTGLRLDPETVSVYVNGVRVDPPLSGPQFELLRLLYDARGTVVSRDDIVARVWPGDDAGGVTEDAVDALVRRLRMRLTEAGAAPSGYIVTVRGYGFRLETP